MFSSLGLIQRLKEMLVNSHDTVQPCVTEPAILAENERLKETVYDLLKSIRDPEKDSSLEDLNVVCEDGIYVQRNRNNNIFMVTVEFVPTVPHCSLVAIIGLCIKIKLERNLVPNYKLRILLKKGSHLTEAEVNKQINDKERVAAAMENATLREVVEKCIKECD